MKYTAVKSIAAAALLAILSLGSCADILDEQPRSIYEPGFFQTEKGVYGGLTAMYAHLRYIYGYAYYYNACLTGTDEATYAQSADGNFKDADLSGAGSLTSSSSRSDVLWNAAFPNINTASGIIKYATEGGVTEAAISEARFFRAFDYLMLVQTFGGVPLDLGAGELTFNNMPVRVSVRNTVPEVYTKGIFPDLRTAVENLPVNPRITGGVTRTVARLFLAKAYLSYAWWLENPGQIPTYPECQRNDPDGHDAHYYYQQAYDIAVAGIEDPGPFALQPTYYDVNLGTNDRNKEILLYADHTEASEFYNGGSLTYASGSAPENFAGWMVTWNYTDIRSAQKPDGTDPLSSVQREAEQHLGRPWTRMCPPIEVFEKTFADKTNDSRYDGTFVTVYRGNWPKGGSKAAVVYNANNMPVSPGGAILTFLDEEPTDGQAVIYPTTAGSSNIGAGTLPDRADYVISPRGISRIVYPGLWKLGPYRTDNGAGLGQPNAASTRPFNIAKFSEFYLTAAEAAVKGATAKSGKSAKDLVNVLRARAGKWRWSNNGDEAKEADNSQAMTDATPDAIDINYILAERSREYFGEGYRWLDLVRTQKWVELASSYTICGSAKGDHTPVTVRRDIKPYHYLRPVPLGQLDGLEMTDAEKGIFQNPGY